MLFYFINNFFTFLILLSKMPIMKVWFIKEIHNKIQIDKKHSNDAKQTTRSKFLKNLKKNSKRNSNSGNEFLLMPNSLESWTISQNWRKKLLTHDEYYYLYMHVSNYCVTHQLQLFWELCANEFDFSL